MVLQPIVNAMLVVSDSGSRRGNRFRKYARNDAGKMQGSQGNQGDMTVTIQGTQSQGFRTEIAVTIQDTEGQGK